MAVMSPRIAAVFSNTARAERPDLGLTLESANPDLCTLFSSRATKYVRTLFNRKVLAMLLEGTDASERAARTAWVRNVASGLVDTAFQPRCEGCCAGGWPIEVESFEDVEDIITFVTFGMCVSCQTEMGYVMGAYC